MKRISRQETRNEMTVHPRGALEAFDETVLRAGNLMVDVAGHQAFIGPSLLELTHQEFELLRLLIANQDRILSFDDLVDQLWGGSSLGTKRQLGVVVCRLRAKLSGCAPYNIQTVRSRGYGLTRSVTSVDRLTRAIAVAAILAATLIRIMVPIGVTHSHSVHTPPRIAQTSARSAPPATAYS